MVLFSACQRWGSAIAPLLVGLLRVAIVLCGGWPVLQLAGARLEWLYALIAGATVLGAGAGHNLCYLAAGPDRKACFRLIICRPLTTEGGG